MDGSEECRQIHCSSRDWGIIIMSLYRDIQIGFAQGKDINAEVDIDKNISLEADNDSKKIMVGTDSQKNVDLYIKKQRSLSLYIGQNQYSCKLRNETTQYWTDNAMYIPGRDEIIVYSDRSVIDGIRIPGVKIGDGNAHVVDLPFLDQELADLLSRLAKSIDDHIRDSAVHITEEERCYWNNKLNCEDNVLAEILVLNRN